MTRDEAIEKIRKILTLTTSSNEHEAALAGETAQRLLSEYQLALTDLDEAEIGRTILARDGGWADVLLMVIASACGCRALMHAEGSLVSLFGTQLDRRTAERLYRQTRPLIEVRSDKAWDAHVSDLQGPFGPHPATTEPGAKQEWVSSYAYGLIETLRKRLVEGYDSRLEPSTAALVRTSRTEARAKVETYVQTRYGSAVTRLPRRAMTVDMGAMREGRKDEL